MYDFEWAEKGRQKMWEKIERAVEGKEPLEGWKEVETERGEFIIAGILKNLNSYEEAVNIPNQGYIVNLPDEVIVEVPAILGSEGLIGLGGCELPEPIAEPVSYTHLDVYKRQGEKSGKGGMQDD